MKIAILDAKTLGDDISLEAFCDYGEVSVYDTTTPTEMHERVADAEVIILNKIRCNAETL